MACCFRKWIFGALFLLCAAFFSACGENQPELTATIFTAPETTPAATTDPEQVFYTPGPVTADCFVLYADGKPRIVCLTDENDSLAVNKAVAVYRSLSGFPAGDPAPLEGEVFHLALAEGGVDVGGLSVSESRYCQVLVDGKYTRYRLRDDDLFNSLQKLFAENQYRGEVSDPNYLNVEAFALQKIKALRQHTWQYSRMRLSKLSILHSFEVNDQTTYFLWRATVRFLRTKGHPAATYWKEQEILIPVLYDQNTRSAALLDDSYCAGIDLDNLYRSAPAAFMRAIHHDPKHAPWYVTARPELWLSFFDVPDGQIEIVTADGQRHGAIPRDRFLFMALGPSYFLWNRTEKPALPDTLFGVELSMADQGHALTIYEGNILRLLAGQEEIWLSDTYPFDVDLYQLARGGLDESEVEIRNFILKTDETDPAKIARQFMEEWGRHLQTGLSPGNTLALRDFSIVDLGVPEMLEGGERFFFAVAYAILPVRDPDTLMYWWAGNTFYGDGAWKDWLTMSRFVQLAKNDQGEWICQGASTGR